MDHAGMEEDRRRLYCYDHGIAYQKPREITVPPENILPARVICKLAMDVLVKHLKKGNLHGK